MSDTYGTHQDWEQQHPDDERMARVYEETRRRHLTNTPRGYQPSRTFPCLGLLQIIDRSTHHWTLRCDRCHFEVAIRAPGRQPVSEASSPVADW